MSSIYLVSGLLSSSAIYPLLLRTITPSKSSATRFVISRETISIVHSTLIISAVLIELHRQSDKWIFSPSSHTNTDVPNLDWKGYVAHTQRKNIVDAAPPSTNAIIAFECGYLIQDFVVLVLGARRFANQRSTEMLQSRRIMARNINWRVLGWHHVGISCALGLYLYRVMRGQAKGSLIVLMMLLMNASTPIGTIHWLMAKFRPAWRSAIFLSHGLYLAVYALARVYLLYWILDVFGAWSGQSAMQALINLKWQCQLGVGLIGTTNTAWLLMGIRKFIRKYFILP